ncbi:uncharacterized protein [Clytia hemisphaerica]|uniref:C2H2-type domain-containing protein n=1 Tax=Clytia hemisphaerica TaxID=252671 RepID=A0A7M5XGI5_9CNID|eukprot:TCONS_00067375-protein
MSDFSGGRNFHHHNSDNRMHNNYRKDLYQEHYGYSFKQNRIMTVETMKTLDLLADREHEKSHREVIIYDSGSPVLKVETGTTLKVLKLLYGAEHERKRQILGVRPKNIGEGGIPCIVTLDDSKLFEISYDILISEDGKEKKETTGEDGNTTNRCIDCSRESWKTKRFTNVGMNTELSLNPGVEVDMSKLNNNSNQQSPNSQAANHDKGAFPPNNGPTVTQHSPSAINPRGGSFLQPKEMHGKPPSRTNGNHHEEAERPPHERPGVTSPTYGVEIYSNHRSSQIRYPSLEPPAHYERFVQPHGWMIERGGRYDPTRPHHENPTLASRRSPGHRSRSPISPRAGEYHPHSHYHAFHEKYRPVLLPTNYMHGSRRRESRHTPAEEKTEPTYIKKENAKEQIQPLTHASEQNDKMGRANLQPGDEPPVFVLPNDYDVVSGIDPRIASMQDKRSGKFSPLSPSHEKEDEKPLKASNIENGEKDLKEEFQNSPSESTGSYSPKGSNGVASGSPDSPPTNSSQKLYCKICSGVFPTKSLLYKHLRGHTSDEKPFKCNECGQGFTLSSNLRQHRIIHRGYKPFQCEFCGKKFMRSNVYKQHRRIHTGEEMHKCGLCPSEFLQKYALLKHMKKNHDIDAVDA